MALPSIDLFVTYKTLTALTEVTGLLGELKGFVHHHPSPKRFTRLCRMKILYDAFIYQDIPLLPEDIALDLVVKKNRHFETHPSIIDDRAYRFGMEEMKHLKTFGFYFLKTLNDKIDPFADKTFHIKPITYTYEEPEVVAEMMLIDQWLINHPTIHPLILLPYLYTQIHKVNAFEHTNERLLTIYLNLYVFKVTQLPMPLLSVHHFLVESKESFILLLSACQSENPRWEDLTLFFLTIIKDTCKQILDNLFKIDQLYQEHVLFLQGIFPNLKTRHWVDHFFFYPVTKANFIREDLQITASPIQRYTDLFRDTRYILVEMIGTEEIFIHRGLKTWMEESFYVKRREKE
jgi:hypothetical protein